MSYDGGRGASESLNKTITEIMSFLNDGSERPRTKLRKALHKKLGDLTERAFRKGFNRGHRESHKAFLKTSEVPRVLQFECSRSLSPNQERELSLKSVILKKGPKPKPPSKRRV